MADVTKTIRMLVIGDASGATKGFQSVGRSMLSSIKHADTFGKKAKVAGLALGGLAATAVIAGAAMAVKFGKESVDAFKRVGAETKTLQRITGMTAEESSRLGFAFKQTGIDAATGARSMTIFEKNVVKMSESDKSAKIKAKEHADAIRTQIKTLEAAGPKTKGYADKLATLKSKLADATTASKMNASALGSMGIKYTDAHGKMLPMSQLLPQVADKFAAMPDGAEKSALAMKLFGKSGTQMLPFLNKGAAGLKELGIQSDKTGNTLSGKQLDAIVANKKAQREWDAAMQGLQVTLGSALLPLLTEGAEFLNSVFVPAIQGVTGFIKDNQAAFDGLGNMMRSFWNSILLPVIKFWIAGNAETVKGLGFILEAAGRLTGNKDLENFGKGIQNAATATQEWANGLKEIPPKVAPKIAINDQATAPVKKIDAQIKSLKGKVVTAKAKGDDAEVKALQKKIDDLKGKRVTIVVGVTMDKGADEVTYKVGTKGSMKFTARAKGGPIIAGRPYWVGENGPEAFLPNVSGHMLSNRASRSLAASAMSSTAGGVVNINVTGVLTETQAGQAIEKAFNKLAQSRGLPGWKVRPA